MSVLSDQYIEKYAKQFNMIEPFMFELLQPASYDVRLSPILRVPHTRSFKSIDLGDPETVKGRTEVFNMDEEGGYALQPGRFVLGSTIESVDIPDYIVGRIEGKSSIARLGLQIHCAGYLDPGFRGNVTVELVNFFDMPIILRPGVKIAQFSFERMTNNARKPYCNERNHYQDSEGTIESKYEEPTGEDEEAA
jgi:dCTP deaminase